VYPVKFTVTVRIEGRFHKKIVPDPIVRVFEGGNDLGLTVFEDRFCFFFSLGH
jgi:hypothetical protein